jgi:serine-type D-Ala-D-Ala carboxypeptidase/endopeptidase
MGARSILAAAAEDYSSADLERMLTNRLRELSIQQSDIGIVLGTIGPHGRKVIGSGSFDGDSVFEIGSVTKAFTALLLADMVRSGGVKLSDPAIRHLPKGTHLPERHGRQICLIDLATHTSGLPFMPDIAPMPDSTEEPGPDDLYRYLASYQLTIDIGTKWGYSNLGYWLLGEALAHRAGVGYEDLLQARVLAPLNLASTSFMLSGTQKSHLATGHNSSLEPAPPISAIPMYSLMPAAGGLYSSVHDLLSLLRAAMGYEGGTLRRAFAISLDSRRPTQQPGFAQALGWTVIGGGTDTLIFRDGATFGFASCLVWDPAQRRGVAVLTNQTAGIADIARHLLRPGFPLEHPAVTRRALVKLGIAVLERCTGQFDAPGEGVFRVTRFPAVRGPHRLGSSNAPSASRERDGIYRGGTAVEI